MRIAISAAIGLELATGAALLGLCSFSGIPCEDFFAIGDARRGAFYFAHVVGGECVDGPRLVVRTALDEVLRARGDRPVFASQPGMAEAEVVTPSAARLGMLASARRAIVSEGNLEPIYLREPHITFPG